MDDNKYILIFPIPILAIVFLILGLFGLLDNFFKEVVNISQNIINWIINNHITFTVITILICIISVLVSSLIYRNLLIFITSTFCATQLPFFQILSIMLLSEANNKQSIASGNWVLFIELILYLILLLANVICLVLNNYYSISEKNLVSNKDDLKEYYFTYSLQGSIGWIINIIIFSVNCFI